jgi:2-keto-3-deoxy-6-phosphogluconate aldolase
MSQETILKRVAALGVVPVIAIEKLEAALPLADALLEAGLPVVEITFRTAAAAEVIRKIAQERPLLVVGAGTVLTPANVEAAKSSGAAFAVAPGAVGGTWIARKEDLASGNWNDIRQRCGIALEIVAKSRGLR